MSKTFQICLPSQSGEIVSQSDSLATLNFDVVRDVENWDLCVRFESGESLPALNVRNPVADFSYLLDCIFALPDDYFTYESLLAYRGNLV